MGPGFLGHLVTPSTSMNHMMARLKKRVQAIQTEYSSSRSPTLLTICFTDIYLMATYYLDTINLFAHTRQSILLLLPLPQPHQSSSALPHSHPADHLDSGHS